MKLIIGLGNPGKQYEKTRHNVGFIFLDKFREENDFSKFKLELKFKGETSEGKHKQEKTILIKPTTYMNLSGESIRKIVDFYKIELDNITVIFDDISMDFGKIRFRDTGSAGGHNGIKSIISHFGKNFKRIKVGVGYDPNYKVSDWVLGKFSEKNLIDLDNEIYEKIVKLINEN